MKRLRSALSLSLVLCSALATQGCVTAIFPAISALGSQVFFDPFGSSVGMHVAV